MNNLVRRKRAMCAAMDANCAMQLDFIHGLRLHYNRLERDAPEEGYDSPGNVPQNKTVLLTISHTKTRLNLLSIRKKHFIAFNRWKQRTVDVIQNYGAAELTHILWLLRLDFKLPTLNKELLFFDRCFTCTSFRFYHWSQVGEVLGNSLSKTKTVVSGLSTGNIMHEKFGSKVYYPVENSGLLVAYGYFRPQDFSAWLDIPMVREACNEKQQALESLGLEDSMAEEIVLKSSLAELLTWSSDNYAKQFEEFRAAVEQSNTQEFLKFYSKTHSLNRKRLSIFTEASPNYEFWHDMMEQHNTLVQLGSAENNEDVKFFMLPKKVRSHTLTRYKMAKSGDLKSIQFLSGLTKIPFNLYEGHCSPEKPKEYLQSVATRLNKSIFGHHSAKKHIMRVIADAIVDSNRDGKQTILGICGPKGNGKTTLIKRGLAECFRNSKGGARQSYFIPLGGSSQGSMLKGHDPAYVGSSWGMIADALIRCGCMDPIIAFDELDKVSNTEYGREITNVLIQITDTSQNEIFEDRFFSGVPLDLSKAILVFSFNDVSAIDPILRDRIHIVHTDVLDVPSKIEICKKYFLPPTQTISDNNIRYIVNNYTKEAGVRHLKQHINTLYNDIQLRRILEGTDCKKIHKTMIDSVLRSDQIFSPEVPQEPVVGQVATLYKTSSGEGGVLLVQAGYSMSKEHVITGLAGQVMCEAFTCAITTAQKFCQKFPSNKKLHLHIYPLDSPKDGASITLAMALAIISLVTDMPVNPGIATSGEVDLNGNICPVGGIDIKLMNAYYAKATTVLIPKGNAHQIQQTILSKKLSVVGVKHLSEAIKIALQQPPTLVSQK
jgi:hypothetical protein